MRLAAASESVTLALWRAVESQHVVSTMVLVDTREEQRLLEVLIESSIPALAVGTQRLHYLLAAPFRYRSPYGSRFRAPNDPGVLYGAEVRRTACAELGYWRWRFLQDSPALERLDTTAQTVFQLGVRGRAVDLRDPPYHAQRAQWTDPVNYGNCQALGVELRDAGVQLVRYESVRDPERGGSGAVLDPAAFAQAEPVAHETWYLLVTRERVRWWRAEWTKGGDAEAWDFETHPFG